VDGRRLNTFADYDAAEAFFKGTAYGDTVRRELLSAYAATAIPGSEQPMITKPDEVRQLYWTAYQKPRSCFRSCAKPSWAARNSIALSRIHAALEGEAPQPAEFFRTIGTLTGRDLDWFWRSWIYTTRGWIRAMDSVRARDDSTFRICRTERRCPPRHPGAALRRRNDRDAQPAGGDVAPRKSLHISHGDREAANECP